MPIYTNEADGNRIVHLGHGDLSIGTSADKTEVIFTPVKVAGVIGEETGLTGNTSEHAPGIRLVFDSPESCMVVIDALSKVCQNLLRGMIAVVRSPDQGCELPPAGWYCTREKGHEGPCAALPLFGGE